METPKQHQPVIVSIGVLTRDEYAKLDETSRGLVDRQAIQLQARYGDGWLARERDRLREELSFAYGVP